MPLIYITGPSGAGKSAVRNELKKRGYEAHDTDENGMSAWYNNQTLELIGPDPVPEKDRPADWYEKHDYRLSVERVKELAERAKTKLIFLCGIPANDKDFREYYDKVICLVADAETVKHRVTTRTTNDFGKAPDELALILHWHGKELERYKAWGATMIDAHQPLNKVVDDVIASVKE